MRLEEAREFLRVAESLAITETGAAGWHVVGSNAVLAGIAALDGICCAHVKEHYQGDDHGGAAEFLGNASGDTKLGATLGRLLSLKPAANYGATSMSASKARNSVQWAKTLVDKAIDLLS
jgi:hypothetical protein